MPNYTLVFRDDGFGFAKWIEFKGQNAASALSVLEGEKDARCAELWSEGEKMAEIVRGRTGLWQINTRSFLYSPLNRRKGVSCFRSRAACELASALGWSKT